MLSLATPYDAYKVRIITIFAGKPGQMQIGLLE